jgi:hypothetical protein
MAIAWAKSSESHAKSIVSVILDISALLKGAITQFLMVSLGAKLILTVAIHQSA